MDDSLQGEYIVTHWSSEYAGLITENMQQALLVTDKDFCIVNANERAVRLFGASSVAELQGLVLAEDGDEHAVQFSSSFLRDGDSQARSGYYRIKTPFGRVLETEVSFSGGNRECPERIVLFSSDHGKRLPDEEFYQSEKLAAMDNIVAGVAHELNNPMTAILGYAELLLATESNPKRKQRIALIAEEADRCAKIIGNMLSFTRSFGNEYETANISALLEEVVSLRAYQMRVDGIEITSDIDRNLPESSVQPSAIRRLFLNILHNAHQALLEVPKEQRLFRVHSKLQNGVVDITISDSGPGIPEDIRYRIFDPFFTTHQLGDGMGLGLSVAYGIVHEHRGKIWMEPREGGGTAIRIELPV